MTKRYRITIELDTDSYRNQIDALAMNLVNRYLEDASVIGIVTKVVYVATDVVDKHILDDRV